MRVYNSNLPIFKGKSTALGWTVLISFKMHLFNPQTVAYPKPTSFWANILFSPFSPSFYTPPQTPLVIVHVYISEDSNGLVWSYSLEIFNVLLIASSREWTRYTSEYVLIANDLSTSYCVYGTCGISSDQRLIIEITDGNPALSIESQI
jgi:hypothetical protein